MPTRKEDLKGLTLLGRPARPGKNLETFPNRHPDRRYTVTLASDEFTCVCPLTGQPDFATITIRYIPDRRVLEVEIAQAVPVVLPRRGRLSRACHQHDLR